MIDSIKNKDGFALVISIVVLALLLALGSAAMTMSQLGYHTYTAEKGYQLATWGADYAVFAGVSSASTSGTLTSGASYQYFYVDGGDYRFIHGTGTFGNARVVKTVVVPAPGNWAGMVTKGGTINNGGSSAIAGCDDDDSDTSCGVVPGVIYKTGGGLSVSGGTQTLTSCTGEGPLNGVAGNPPTQTKDLPDDLTSTYFNSDNYSDLKSDLGTKYGVDVTNLTAGTIPTSCQYTGASSCSTTSSTNIKCGTTNIDLSTCPKVYIQSSILTLNTSISNVTVVSGGTVNISGNNKTFTNTNVFSNTLDFDLGANTEVRGGTLYSSGNTTIGANGNPSLGTTSSPVLLISGGATFSAPGNLTINGLVYTSAANISITGSVELQGALINNSANATINNTGNGTIQFNNSVLKELSSDLGGNITKKPNCGNKKSYISNTKTTVY